jgi:hypothetical protein
MKTFNRLLLFAALLALLSATARPGEPIRRGAAATQPPQRLADETEAWKEKISLHLPAITAALEADKSAAGVYDVRPLNDGRVGVGTITDYGYTLFHVYDPAAEAILHTEAILFARADRERLSVFFARQAPSETRYHILPVRSKKPEPQILGWLGIPLARVFEDKGASKERELLAALASMEMPEENAVSPAPARKRKQRAHVPARKTAPAEAPELQEITSEEILRQWREEIRRNAELSAMKTEDILRRFRSQITREGK